MKRTRSYLGILFGVLFLLCLLASVSLAPAFAYADEETVAIATVQDFVNLAISYEGSESGSGHVYELTADVDLSEETLFSSIGKGRAFNGVFNGNGHTVTVALNENSRVGLFAEVSPIGVVRDLVVKGSVHATHGTCGGIAGQNNGRIERCVNYASISGDNNSYFGGIVGQNNGIVVDCVNFGQVAARSFVGGLVGQNKGDRAEVTSCVNFGDIDATGGSASNVGGLVGESAGYLADSYSLGGVSAVGSGRIGSAVGYLSVEGKNVYALSSARSVVGGAVMTEIPDSFRAVTTYDLLSDKATFSEGTLSSLPAVSGHGYLPSPAFVEGDLADEFLLPLFDGEGTAEDPYIISSANDFDLFATNSKTFSYEGKYLQLTNSFRISEGQYASSSAVGFSGTFDGDGHRLEYALEGGSYLGLFARIGAGTVKNLSVDATLSGSDYVGAITGSSDGLVQNVTVTGTIRGTNYVGGVVGRAAGRLSDCTVSAQVSGVRYVGGIAGYSQTDIAQGLTALSAVSMEAGASYAYFGGIFGSAIGPMTASDLVFTSALSAYKADKTGGLFGYAEEVTTENAAVIGSVSGRNGVGGLIGETSGGGTTTDAFVCGVVNGATKVGGLVGEGAPAIERAYFSGTLGEVREAQVDRNTFRTIAPAGANLPSVYYNADKIFSGTDGIGKYAVEFTRGDLLTGGAWNAPDYSDDYGYFPYVDPNDAISGNESVLQTLYYAYFGGGAGTSQAPYVLSQEDHFRNLSYLARADEEYLTKDYVQGDDVTFLRDFDGIRGSFSGRFSGNGYLVEDLKVYGVGALFEEIAVGGTVEGLTVFSGSFTTATVAKNNLGTVKECLSKGTVSGEGDLGGLVQNNVGAVSDCLFSGKVIGRNAGTKAGGLVGVNAGSVVGCIASGLVEGVGYIGGATGENDGVVNRVLVSATLHAKGDGYYLGGLSGTHSGGTFDNALFIGTVYVDGEKYSAQPRIGAIIGYYDEDRVPTIAAQRVLFNRDFAPFSSRFGSLNVTVQGFAQNTAYIANNSGSILHSFTVLDESDEQDDFAAVPEYFASCPIITAIEARVASGMCHFGWDGLSDEPKGSENNPYLISDEDQFFAIREHVLYSGTYAYKYFRLVADVDFTNEFRPIGRYLSPGAEDNRVFEGSFDGDGHTVDYLSIEENEGYGYVGLFAYTSKNFVLKDLVIGPHSHLTSTWSYVGSFVGNNAGTITGCVSFATLSAPDFVGGIAAMTAVGTEVTHCAFAGRIECAGSNAFGVTAQSADRVPRFDATDSWYVLDEGTFVEGGRENYVHNDYGSVLFVDRGGDVSVSRTETGLRFLLLPEVGLSGCLMSVKDVRLYSESGEGFLTALDENVVSGKSVKYYARFLSHASATWTGGDLISDGYGEGDYYQGQSVTFAFDVKYGYFIHSGDYSEVQGRWVTATDTVNIAFVKPAGEYVMELDVRDFTDYGALNCGVDLVYDGENKEIGFEYLPEYADLFNAEAGRNGISYYTLPDQARASAVKNAGSYRVVARIYLAGENRACGRIVKEIVVSPATLTVKEGETDYWQTFVSKTYDGRTSATLSVNNAYVDGLFIGDYDTVGVHATVVWDAPTAGATHADISDFTLAGASAGNYILTPCQMQDVNAVISKKEVTYAIAPDRLSGSYTGAAPAIVGTLNTSIGSASVTFSFLKLVGDEGAVVDEEWVAAGGNTWHVGRYRVDVGCSDEVDYEIVSEEYVYTVTPFEIKTLSFSGYENLVYDGGAKLVIGYYDTVNGAMERVGFEFYRQKEGGEFVFDDVEYEEKPSATDAGRYLAKPVLENEDYYLSERVDALFFTIEKNDSAGDVTFAFDGETEVEIGSKIPLTVTSDVYDATLVVQPLGGTRGRAKLVKTGENTYDFVPTAYTTNGAFSFRIAAIDSENYADRYSDGASVTIVAGTIYVGLTEESSRIVFGTVPAPVPVYSYRSDLTDPIADTAEIEGFSAPSFSVDAEVLHASDIPYSVNMIGGDSAGYKIVPVASRCLLTVEKRPVRVSVTEEHNNKKTYGEEDGEILYTLLDGVDGNVRLEQTEDGNAVVLLGALSRAPGENAGRYDIDLGDLVERNGDYLFTSAVSAQYVIEKRGVELCLDAVEKYYGDVDPEITFSAVNGTSFAKEEDRADITLRVSRAEGEDVGRYPYTVLSYGGNDNYVVDRLDARTNVFTIRRATPSISYSVLGEIEYGDPLQKLVVTGDAFSFGVPVRGSFSWRTPDYEVDEVGNMSVELTFLPASDNYAPVFERTEITVKPRELDVSFTGDFAYTYTGRRQCNIVASVANPAFGESVELVGETDETPINAGRYAYVVSVSDEHYVVSENNKTVYFTILPATVTVKVSDANVEIGERYTPEITYSGFVNGENERVLSSRATVKNVPNEGGTYEVVASGAAADNYEFSYVVGIVRIAKESAVSSLAAVSGELPAETALTCKNYSGVSLTIREQELNVALNHNVFVPNFQKLSAYVQVESNVRLEGELTYVVKIDLPQNGIVYAVLRNGSVSRVEYEIVESDLKTAAEEGEEGSDERVEIAFTSEEIVGVAVFTPKEVGEIVLSLLPDIGIGIGVGIVVVIVVLVCVAIRKRDKRKERYRGYLDGKY